ncbi:MAG: alpha/beta hydrolase, partial [Pseudomonadota bacterium]
MSLEQVRALRTMLANRPTDLPLDARRAGFEAMMAQLPLAEGVTATPVSEDVHGIWLDPLGKRTGQIILHVHGGAFVLGSARSYQSFCSRLAKASGLSVFALDYPLAPENPFPAGLDATIKALEWLRDSGFQTSDIGL